MTITTASSEHRAIARRARRRGVTLVELMVALVISATVLSAVFGSFLFLARSSLLTASYSGMDAEARKGLEVFARDVRMADNISNFSANGMRLHVQMGPSGAYYVNYTYEPEKKAFYRQRDGGPSQALMTGVDTFILDRFSLKQDPLTNQPIAATNDLETKQLQIQLHAIRSGAARADATNNVISARYILRNKIVSN